MPGETIACPEAYAALRDAVSAGLRIVRDHEQRGGYIHEHFDFPEMGYFDSGMPSFSKVTWGSEKAPKDYKSIFEEIHKPDKVPEWRPYYTLVRGDDRLQRYYDEMPMYRTDVEGISERLEYSSNFAIGYTITRFVDRYIHLYRSREFDEGHFRVIYGEWERAVFDKRLSFDILIPVLMVACDFDVLEVGEGLCIERMTEPVQLARSTASRFPVSANDCVVGAATHALVMKNWTIENNSAFLLSCALHSVENFRDAVRSVDYFFAALRAVTGAQTGYSQLVIRPNGWGTSWVAYLPHIHVIPLRAYPDQFENYRWLREPSVLAEAACRKAGRLYTSIISLKANRLFVAARRLNFALLRSSEQDAIIDVAIGLETLLVPDGGHGEVTHKLAMRLGAICRMCPLEGHKSFEVFEICKKLYAFRSSVAHGSDDVSKKRVLKVRSAREPIEAIVLGIAMLRHVVTFLGENPEYLDAKKLDMTLLADMHSGEEDTGFPL